MLGRILGVGLLAAVAACYNAPEPDCGFTCGPGGACPADYTCAADHVCHRNGFSGTCPGRSDAGIDAPASFAVVSTLPADGATGVQVNQVIKAMVDRDLTGVTDATFYLQAGSTMVPATASYSLGSFVMRLVPSLQLAPSTSFTAVIATGIHDFSGPASLQPTQWSFTTGADTVAPQLVSSSPFTSEANVPTTTTITVVFDEAVTGVDTTSLTVTDGVTPVAGTIAATSATTFVFTPTAALAAATTYTVSLSNAIHDAYANALSPTSFTFTTQ